MNNIHLQEEKQKLEEKIQKQNDLIGNIEKRMGENYHKSLIEIEEKKWSTLPSSITIYYSQSCGGLKSSIKGEISNWYLLFPQNIDIFFEEAICLSSFKILARDLTSLNSKFILRGIDDEKNIFSYLYSKEEQFENYNVERTFIIPPELVLPFRHFQLIPQRNAISLLLS